MYDFLQVDEWVQSLDKVFFFFFCLSYVNESKHANNTWLIAFISITMRLETTLPSTDKVLNNRLWILCKLLMQVSF